MSQHSGKFSSQKALSGACDADRFLDQKIEAKRPFGMPQPAFTVSGLKLYQLISVVDNICYGTKTATL